MDQEQNERFSHPLLQPQPQIIPLFPAMVNPIIIPDDLAKEFLEWAHLLDLSEYKVFEDGPEIHVCDRMVSRIEQQLKLHGRDKNES